MKSRRVAEQISFISAFLLPYSPAGWTWYSLILCGWISHAYEHPHPVSSDSTNRGNFPQKSLKIMENFWLLLKYGKRNYDLGRTKQVTLIRSLGAGNGLRWHYCIHICCAAGNFQVLRTHIIAWDIRIEVLQRSWIVEACTMKISRTSLSLSFLLNLVVITVTTD